MTVFAGEKKIENLKPANYLSDIIGTFPRFHLSFTET